MYIKKGVQNIDGKNKNIYNIEGSRKKYIKYNNKYIDIHTYRKCLKKKRGQIGGKPQCRINVAATDFLKDYNSWDEKITDSASFDNLSDITKRYVNILRVQGDKDVSLWLVNKNYQSYIEKIKEVLNGLLKMIEGNETDNLQDVLTEVKKTEVMMTKFSGRIPENDEIIKKIRDIFQIVKEAEETEAKAEADAKAQPKAEETKATEAKKAFNTMGTTEQKADMKAPVRATEPPAPLGKTDATGFERRGTTHLKMDDVMTRKVRVREATQRRAAAPGAVKKEATESKAESKVESKVESKAAAAPVRATEAPMRAMTLMEMGTNGAKGARRIGATAANNMRERIQKIPTVKKVMKLGTMAMRNMAASSKYTASANEVVSTEAATLTTAASSQTPSPLGSDDAKQTDAKGMSKDEEVVHMVQPPPHSDNFKRNPNVVAEEMAAEANAATEAKLVALQDAISRRRVARQEAKAAAVKKEAKAAKAADVKAAADATGMIASTAAWTNRLNPLQPQVVSEKNEEELRALMLEANETNQKVYNKKVEISRLNTEDKLQADLIAKAIKNKKRETEAAKQQQQTKGDTEGERNSGPPNAKDITKKERAVESSPAAEQPQQHQPAAESQRETIASSESSESSSAQPPATRKTSASSEAAKAAQRNTSVAILKAATQVGERVVESKTVAKKIQAPPQPKAAQAARVGEGVIGSTLPPISGPKSGNFTMDAEKLSQYLEKKRQDQIQTEKDEAIKQQKAQNTLSEKQKRAAQNQEDEIYNRRQEAEQNQEEERQRAEQSLRETESQREAQRQRAVESQAAESQAAESQAAESQAAPKADDFSQPYYNLSGGKKRSRTSKQQSAKPVKRGHNSKRPGSVGGSIMFGMKRLNDICKKNRLMTRRRSGEKLTVKEMKDKLKKRGLI